MESADQSVRGSLVIFSGKPFAFRIGVSSTFLVDKNVLILTFLHSRDVAVLLRYKSIDLIVDQ